MTATHDPILEKLLSDYEEALTALKAITLTDEAAFQLHFSRLAAARNAVLAHYENQHDGQPTRRVRASVIFAALIRAAASH